MSVAPVHIVVCAREQDYHDRYNEPDKLAATGGVEVEWPAPFWFVDAGAAMMLLLLAAIDEGLAAGVYGVTVPEMQAFKELLGIPDDVAVVAGVTMGKAQGRPELEPRVESHDAAPARARRGRPLGTLVERLAAARIGDTFNQYRDDRLAQRLARYLEERAGAPILLVGEAAGYRGARVSGIPFTSERQLTGAGPAEATATIVHRVLEELDLERRRAPLERRADASRDRRLESQADTGRGRGGDAVRARARARASCLRRRPDRRGCAGRAVRPASVQGRGGRLP